MMQVAEPSLPDGMLLSRELTKQFPEVPPDVIQDIMQKNSNNRELCFEALNRECQRYQDNLYGVPSLDEHRSDELQDCTESLGFVILPDLETGPGRRRSSSQGRELVDANLPALTQDVLQAQERPILYHPTFTPPVLHTVVTSPGFDGSRTQQSSGAQPPLGLSSPFSHLHSPGDQRYYMPMPTLTPPQADSNAFTDRPLNHPYGTYQLQNFPSPSFGNNLLLQPVAPRMGTRSPLPLHGQQKQGYHIDPYYNASTIPSHLRLEDPSSIMLHLNQTLAGSSVGVPAGLPYLSQDILMAGQPRLSYLQPVSSRDTSAADMLVFSSSAPVFEVSSNSHPAQQMSCPGSASSSRSGSLAGEDLAYIQALLIYQKARLDAFQSDLNRQKETLEVLRNEVGQLQTQSLNRRLARNDFFPTAADRQTLVTENQNLRLEIQLLTYDLDIAFSGNTHLGWLDSGDQKFHDVIPSGQFHPPVIVGSSNSVQPPHPPDSSLPVVPPFGQQSSINSQVSLPLKPTRPPPPRPFPLRIQTNPVPNDPEDGESWNCSACTFLNHPLLNKCECCEMPKLPATPSALR